MEGRRIAEGQFLHVARQISNGKGTKEHGRAFVAGISEFGVPDDIAWLLDYLFSTVLDGRNAYVCDGVKRALGREPRDFSVYAREAAATGVWNAAVRS